MLPRLRIFLWLAIALAVAPARAQTPPTSSKPFIVAADTEGFAYNYARLVYFEAFRRLGIPVSVEIYALARRSAMIAQGAIDAEGSRVLAYADAHPELIRVEEPVLDVTFSVFAADPNLRARGIDSLPSTAVVEYRRGILMCENALKKAISPERLSSVVTSEQGIKKMLAGRSDAFCDIDVYFNEAMQSPEFQGVTKPRKLFELASLPTYPYLSKKHVELAPRLAEVLKKMKSEGLLDRYRLEATRGPTATR